MLTFYYSRWGHWGIPWRFTVHLHDWTRQPICISSLLFRFPSSSYESKLPSPTAPGLAVKPALWPLDTRCPPSLVSESGTLSGCLGAAFWPQQLTHHPCPPPLPRLLHPAQQQIVLPVPIICHLMYETQSLMIAAANICTVVKTSLH